MKRNVHGLRSGVPGSLWGPVSVPSPSSKTKEPSRVAATWLLLPLCLLLLAPTLRGGPAVQAWVQRYPGASGAKVAVDPEGNVIVAAQLSGWHGLIIKYSGGGVALWTNIWGTFPSVVRGMALDNGGNVYVTGYWDLGMGIPPEYETVAYASNGAPLWTNSYNGSANLNDQAFGVAVDGSGNVYVSGVSAISLPFPPGNYTIDYATIAYSNAGTPLWTNRYAAYWDGYPPTIAVDPRGNVYVTGTGCAPAEGCAPGYATISLLERWHTPVEQCLGLLWSLWRRPGNGGGCQRHCLCHG